MAKNLLPKPMGVGLFAVTGITGNMFAMVTYAVQVSPFGYGYSTYANYATLAGQVLTWAATAFGSLLATIFAAWGVRLFKLAGQDLSASARARLQEIILNGLNIGAQAAAKNLAGRDPVVVKDAVVAQAIAYTQTHGADTIKALGLDPHNGTAVEAIRARIETAIADPNVPTPEVLGGPPLAAKAA